MTCSTEHLRCSDKAYLLVRNPSSVFVCWTWSEASARVLGSADYEPDVMVRLSSVDNKDLAVESLGRWDSGGIYLRPPAEGKTYAASVYARKKGGQMEKLLESNAALTPVSLAASGVSSGCVASGSFGRDGGI